MAMSRARRTTETFMTTENVSTEKTPAEAPDKGVGCRDLLGEGESQTPRTDAEILLCSDGTTAVPASLARNMEHELGEARKAERLARVQLEKAREQRDELRYLARAVEPFASEQACNRREMAVHDACRKMRPLIYDESAMSDNDARIVIGRTAKRGGWNA